MLAAVATAFLFLAAPPSSDASVAINGDVLRVYANPEERIQARFVGFDAGEFDFPFPDSGAALAGLALNVYTDPNNDAPAGISGPFFGGTTPISGRRSREAGRRPSRLS